MVAYRAWSNCVANKIKLILLNKGLSAYVSRRRFGLTVTWITLRQSDKVPSPWSERGIGYSIV